ncbi:MAG TPA: FIST N-terminal domain-containing protein [Candidatus Saccharimonadales bacterium]|nr:FIST N-terminal domain-containing protein [Candidatus Saccharimonadales bacterium]
MRSPQRPTTGIRVGAGLSTHTDGVAAARAALDAALGGVAGPPDLLLLFVAPQHENEFEAILRHANERADGATVLGCSASGIIGGSSEVEDAPAVSAWAARLPDATIRPYRLTFAREEDHAVIEGLDELPSPDEAPVVLMLADPFSFPADVLLEHLNETATGLPIVGGMASGGLEAGRNALFFNDEILRDGAVGAIITGAPGLSVFVSQGCRPVGETYGVTRAERNVVYELAGAPAIQRIEELYAAASERDQLLMRRGLHLGRAFTEIKPVLVRGDFLIRNVVGIDQDSGAIAISDNIEVGQTVQFQVRDAESAREDLQLTLARERGTADRPVAGALLFSCNGRGTGLFGQPDHDIGALHKAFGPVPVAGMFASGEIGPVGGKNFLHGFTAAVLLLRDA